MTDYLLVIFLFLVAGVVAVPLASRFKLGSVLGYLIAGITISPILTLLHVDVTSIQHIAEFGVVMMLFLVGLELEPKVLWDMRAKLLGLGGLQVALTSMLVMAIAMALGQPWRVSLAIGMVLALSSTAIVLQTLNERGLMKSDGGQSSFSVLLFQDIAVIPMLALLPLLAMPEVMDAAAELAAHAETDHAGSGMSLVNGLPGWQAGLMTLAAIGLVIFGGSRLTGPIFRFISSARLRELFTTTALMIVVGIALLMSLVGLSPALGTFIAGVVLANSEYRHELESDIDPFKGLLLGVFFMTVGANIDFQLLMDNAGGIVGLTLTLILLKRAVLLLLARVFTIQGADGWLFALGMAQAGEFGFVLLSFTVAASVIPSVVADQLLLIVALSMLLTPALFITFDRLIAPRFSKTAARGADEIDTQCSIIIAGHGRVGGIVNRILRAAGNETIVIDYNSEQLELLRAFGLKVYFGDATRPDLLHAAGIDEAKLLIIAIDDKAQITRLVEYMVKHPPQVHVVARARDRHHVYDLYAAGCRDIIRETFDSSVRMGRSALEAIGMPHDRAIAFTELMVEKDKELLREMATLYNPNIPTKDNPAYVAKARELREAMEKELKEKMLRFRRLSRPFDTPTQTFLE